MKTAFGKIFGLNDFYALHLRQFFKQHLSRKAEGYGPMKPWQPTQYTRLCEGANSSYSSL